MSFEKNYDHRWKPNSDKALEKSPICFKGREGQKEALLLVDGWQGKLRDYIDELINIKPS